MAILLKNPTYIDWKSLEFIRRDIYIESGDSSIRFIEGDDFKDAGRDTEIIDCSGKLVTKSFAIGHHHAYSALSRGMGAPAKQPANFSEILKYVWWTLDKCLDKDMIESSALVTAMACVKAGSTFIIDHHASPFAVRGSLELMAKAFDRVGVSHLLCYEVSDRDGTDIARQGLDETEEYLKTRQGLVGLHASFTVGDDTLKQAVALMNRFNSGVHIHVAEDAWDQEHCIKNYRKRVVERLSEAGALTSSKTILVHALHLNDYEHDIIRNSPAWVVQNCESNLNNNVGYFNGAQMGNNIMLGTDGMHSDMLQSTKASFFVGQRYDSINYLSAYVRFRNVHRYLSENCFKGDGDNNLVILDYDSPTAVTQDNFLGHFIFGINAGHIRDVISNGRLVVRDRKITTVDETEILNISKIHAERLWKKMSEAKFY